MTYTVDVEALRASAPTFQVLAQDMLDTGKNVVDATSSLADMLGDPAVITSVGAVSTALLGDLQVVHSGMTQLGSVVAANGDGYAANEQRTAAGYRAAGSGGTPRGC